MRVAYLIQNHRAPRQAERLVAALRRAGDPPILVCHDEFAGCCTARELSAALAVEVLPTRRPARRGYFSMIEPYFDGVGRLAARGESYDWLVYLSATDYPIRPLAELERMLARTDVDGFLRHWPAFSEHGPWGRRHQGVRRYAFQYFDAPAWARPALRLLKVVNGIQDLVHLHLVYGPRVGIRVRSSPFRDGYRCWAGLQWTVLRRAAAETAAEACRADPRLRAWFERTICPDEAVVQTILLNKAGFRFADDDLRYVDFEGSRDGHPRLLTSADLGTLVQCGKHFARKFDPEVDAHVLDRLDELAA